MKEKLTSLVDVKSIITIVLTVVFGAMTMKNMIDSEKFFIVYQMIIVFYFGTQFGKKQSEDKGEK